MLKKLQLVLMGGVLTLSLTACGSSSTETPLTTDFSFSGAKSGTLDTATYNQIDVLNPDLPASLNVDSIPSSGSALLDGIIEVQITSPGIGDGKGSENFAGNLTMELDFTSSNIDVDADGFAAVSETGDRLLSPVEGNLFGDGKINATSSEVGLDFVLSGSLEGSSSYTFSDLTASGQLYNTPEVDLIGTGEVSGNGTSTGDTKLELFGGFVAISP